MNSSLLLDTCAAIWIVQNAAMSDLAVAAIDESVDAGRAIYASPITAWEIGMLAARGRFKSSLPRSAGFAACSTPGVKLADISADILIASSFLPGNLRRDPADRILAATAREFDWILVTRDAALLDYAAEGHIRALAC